MSQLRIWKGEEMEGKHRNDLTLFVEAVILKPYFNTVIDTITKNADVVRVYLGAGGKFTYLNDAITLCNMINATNSKLHVVVECTSLQLSLLDEETANKLSVFDEVIVTTNFNSLSLPVNYVPKFQDSNNLIMFEKESTTDITTVYNGLYDAVDTLLWEE